MVYKYIFIITVLLKSYEVCFEIILLVNIYLNHT